MTRAVVGIAVFVVIAVWSQPVSLAEVARIQSGSVEVAFVANAEGGSVALLDVASRSVVGAVDVNPARVKSVGPGAPNYAQDTDVSLYGRRLYVSRGYVGDVAAFDIASGRLLWRRSLNTALSGLLN
jgi:hypothetical protein